MLTPFLASDGDWDDRGVFTALTLNLMVAGGILVVYMILRRNPRTRYAYVPRSDPEHKVTVALPKLVGEDARLPEPEGLLGWLTTTWKITTDDILAHCGFRAAMYLLLVKRMIFVLFVAALLCGCVLVPVNLTGTNVEKLAKDNGEIYLKGFAEWTVTNMDKNDPKLWVHLGVYLLIVAFFYSMIGAYSYEFYQNLRKYRHAKGMSADVSAHTVMISDLPRGLRQDGPLMDRIERMYPGKVANVTLAYDLNKLTTLRGKEFSFVNQLSNLYGMWSVKGERPVMKLKIKDAIPNPCGQKVDAIDHFYGKLDELQPLITEELERKDHPTTSYAFVTFTDALTAKSFVQNYSFKYEKTLIDAENFPTYVTTKLKVIEVPPKTERVEATQWNVQPAPIPEHVIWENLGITPLSRKVRFLLLSAATVWLVVFWAIPVGFLGSLDKLADLDGIGPAFQVLLDLPAVIVGFLTAYLPLIVVIIFMAILPLILTKFSMIEGVTTLSELQVKVMQKFYLFVLFSVVILPAIFIGSLSQLNEIIANIGSEPFPALMDLLNSITAPTTGLFIVYLIQKSLMGWAIGLLRIGPLIVGYLKAKLATTPRDQEEAKKVGEFMYHFNYPHLLLMLTISFFFAMTIPLTPVFGLLVFCTKYVADKYSICYIHPTPPETDGRLTAGALRLVLVIQCLMQIATCGMFLSKEAWPQFGIALALFLVSLFTFRGFDSEIEQIFKQQAFIELEEMNERAGLIAKEVNKDKLAALGYSSDASSVSESESSSLEVDESYTSTDALVGPSEQDIATAYIHPSVTGIPPGESEPVIDRLKEYEKAAGVGSDEELESIGSSSSLSASESVSGSSSYGSDESEAASDSEASSSEASSS